MSSRLFHCPTVVPHVVWCSDDVDDQYTEKGRILIRKEGEALANGMKIGEILAADDLELQLPGIKPKKRKYMSLPCDYLSLCRKHLS